MNVSAKPPLKLKKRHPTKLQLQQPKFLFGQRSEQQAAIFLQRAGYRILDRNVSWGRHELDLVAEDPSCGDLVFIEVKSRATTQFGSAAAGVSWRQLRSLTRAANQYRRQRHRWRQPFRFDIIAVQPDTIQHYQNVTWLG